MIQQNLRMNHLKYTTLKFVKYDSLIFLWFYNFDMIFPNMSLLILQDIIHNFTLVEINFNIEKYFTNQF